MSKKTQLSYLNGGSITGRSGINLDMFGHRKTKNSITFWVVDGVSPVIFSKRDRWKFRTFFKASKILNRCFEEHQWSYLPEDFNKIGKKIREGLYKNTFISGLFYVRPLFSIALVNVDFSSKKVKIALYGDCVIFLQSEGDYIKLENIEIERLKTSLNKCFSIIEKTFPLPMFFLLKKLVFGVIRLIQTKLGKYRVYDVGQEFEPEVYQTYDLSSIDNVYLMSDGLSWHTKSRKDLLDVVGEIDSNGAQRALLKIREREDDNKDFGRNDDSTAMHLNVEALRKCLD